MCVYIAVKPVLNKDDRPMALYAKTIFSDERGSELFARKNHAANHDDAQTKTYMY
jgi:hypothetical protein